ncbi:MAG: hypothetical protein AB1776_08180 [Bacillota bacterium]
MRCDFCGLEFNEEEARRACGGCPLAGMCGRLRCPRCGYEALPEPKWLKMLRSWGGKILAGYRAGVRI